MSVCLWISVQEQDVFSRVTMMLFLPNYVTIIEETPNDSGSNQPKLNAWLKHWRKRQNMFFISSEFHTLNTYKAWTFLCLRQEPLAPLRGLRLSLKYFIISSYLKIKTTSFL